MVWKIFAARGLIYQTIFFQIGLAYAREGRQS